jgi:hypothetical protein
MPEEYYSQHFPSLGSGFRRSSEPDYYNCIALVVGDTVRKWWPGEYDPYWSDDYWPEGVPPENTISAFTSALSTADYYPCDNGDWEDGFEKAVLYMKDGVVTHGAIQIKNGVWKSKLGSDEDIEHALDGICGPFYGTVAAFFRRVRENR